MANISVENESSGIISIVNKLLFVIIVLVVALVIIPLVFFLGGPVPGDEKKAEVPSKTSTASPSKNAGSFWMALSLNDIADPKMKEQVEYGKELIAHTSKYLGPNGSVSRISNGMNCQNCHLQAGTMTFGNNYGSVASLYPKFRARSGTVENIYKRVNDCFERSLNGTALDTTGREMQAIAAYINYIGSNVDKGKKAEGSGLKDLTYLDRPADPANGKSVYVAKCQSCHQPNGEGQLLPDNSEYAFPPLWGNNSYNDGAGLFRISNMARYVKYNMPLGANHENTLLSDEEAWDVSAFINTQPRPHINAKKDWPDKSLKPFDHPFGPYADEFTEQQHKLGPYKPIIEAQKKASNNQTAQLNPKP